MDLLTTFLQRPQRDAFLEGSAELSAAQEPALPLYLSSTSSYARANSFSWEWLVGSRPGINPAMVARPAGFGGGPLRRCSCGYFSDPERSQRDYGL